jgi:hypothetical protein
MKKFAAAIIFVVLAAIYLLAQINNPGGGGGTSCGTPTCTVSTAGGGNGVLALSGNTSGSCTLTTDATGTTDTSSCLLAAPNACRVTADVSLTVNVANSFCSFSLPALAHAWSWQCNIIWAITAGTGVNSFALGVNASQTPTGATNAAAGIYTTQLGVQTQGVAALNASGAITMLTSPTYAPAATLEQAYSSGTLVASAIAGTFAITATANGTTVTAAIKAGSTCYLY